MREKEINQIQKMKVLLVVEPLLLPMLEEKNQLILSKIHQKYQVGDKDFVAEVAQLGLIKELISELDAIKRQGAVAQKKLDLETEGQ